MTDSRQQRIIRRCASLLQLVGALTFLFGDAFLFEIKHVNFFLSMLIGILGGVLLVFLGTGLKIVSRSRPE